MQSNTNSILIKCKVLVIMKMNHLVVDENVCKTSYNHTRGTPCTLFMPTHPPLLGLRHRPPPPPRLRKPPP